MFPQLYHLLEVLAHLQVTPAEDIEDNSEDQKDNRLRRGPAWWLWYGPKTSQGTNTPNNKDPKKKIDKRDQRLLNAMFGNKRTLSPVEGMSRKSKREKYHISS